MVPPVPLFPLAHCPMVVSDPHEPVYTSMSSPGLLLILLTVIVHVPFLVARTINQTLLLTTASPQLNAGSLPMVVAPIVLRFIELLAHNETAAAQLSWALALILKNNISILK